MSDRRWCLLNAAGWGTIALVFVCAQAVGDLDNSVGWFGGAATAALAATYVALAFRDP